MLHIFGKKSMEVQAWRGSRTFLSLFEKSFLCFQAIFFFEASQNLAAGDKTKKVLSFDCIF